MSLFPAIRNLAEPGFIVAAFTFGTLITRRRTHSVHIPADEEHGPKTKHDQMSHATYGSGKLNLQSRFLRKFPFLIEIWYWNLTYWVYQLLRALSATVIRGNRPIFVVAENHALSILSLESKLGLDVEQPLQRYILQYYPGFMSVLARIYYSHICLGICFLIYVYTYCPPNIFRRIRRSIAINNAIAFVILSIWRCMPPRLLPEKYGFEDVLHGGSHGGSVWTSNRFQLTIAAMPSLHFGTSLFLAYCIARFSPHRWLRAIAPIWPAAMLFTILATGNHFVLDAAVGACVPMLGWRLNQVLLRLLPLQDKAFNFLGIQYPDDIDRQSSQAERASLD